MTTDQRRDDSSGWMARLRRTMTESFGDLHRSERGATLTEFVIVLPIFITVFVAIMRFGILQSTTVRVQMSATKGLWEEAIPKQTQQNPGQRFTDPSQASSDPGGVVDAPSDRAFSHTADNDMVAGIDRGTTGEAAAAVDNTNAASNADLGKLPPSVQGNLEAQTSRVVERRRVNYEHGPTYAEELIDDRSAQASSNNPHDARAPLDKMGLSSRPHRMSNASYAAGVRYGLVKAKEKPTSAALADIPTLSPADLEVGYTTMVAPHPMVHSNGDELSRPIGVARRTMADTDYIFRDAYGIDYAP